MELNNNIEKSQFYAIGISYKKADAQKRGLFSIDQEKQIQLLQQAKKEGIEALFIISTCNRTELYGYVSHPYILIKKLCDFSKASVDDFREIGYVYKENEAINHIFSVGTGLDSQILGDFEIIGQFKKSFNLSKEYLMTNANLERLHNSVVQASKRVKNETELSSGATSVSFASVNYILDNVKDIDSKNILLFGVGEIGRNTCENLVKHINNKKITLINRTKDKALEVAGRFNVEVQEFENLQREINRSDVLIVATGADRPTVTQDMIKERGNKPIIILDLSIPQNVDSEISALENALVVNIDQLSEMTDQTLERRKGAIPMAMQIIEEVKNDFIKWVEMREFTPFIQKLKVSLEAIRDGEIENQNKKNTDFDVEQATFITNRLIQKITTQFMNHLKDSSSPYQSIALLKDVFKQK